MSIIFLFPTDVFILVSSHFITQFRTSSTIFSLKKLKWWQARYYGNGLMTRSILIAWKQRLLLRFITTLQHVAWKLRNDYLYFQLLPAFYQTYLFTLEVFGSRPILYLEYFFSDCDHFKLKIALFVLFH